MKHLLLFLLVALSLSAEAAQQVITPGAGITGAQGRDMINANFAELYARPAIPASGAGVVTVSAGTISLTGPYLTPTGDGHQLTGLTKAQVGLANVENTALSTWAGTTNITTLGTITNLTATGDVALGPGYNGGPVIRCNNQGAILSVFGDIATLGTDLVINTRGNFAWTTGAPFGGAYATVLNGGVSNTLVQRNGSADQRYILGPATSSGVQLKQSAGAITFRKADDSANADLNAASLSASGSFLGSNLASAAEIRIHSNNCIIDAPSAGTLALINNDGTQRVYLVISNNALSQVNGAAPQTFELAGSNGTIGSGLILSSANGTRYKITVGNDGTLATAVAP